MNQSNMPGILSDPFLSEDLLKIGKKVYDGSRISNEDASVLFE